MLSNRFHQSPFVAGMKSPFPPRHLRITVTFLNLLARPIESTVAPHHHIQSSDSSFTSQHSHTRYPPYNTYHYIGPSIRLLPLSTINLVATIIIFAAVIYLQGFCIEIPVKSNRFRGQRRSYPVDLFYKSGVPIVLESALASMSLLFRCQPRCRTRTPDTASLPALCSGVAVLLFSVSGVSPGHDSLFSPLLDLSCTLKQRSRVQLIK